MARITGLSGPSARASRTLPRAHGRCAPADPWGDSSATHPGLTHLEDHAGETNPWDAVHEKTSLLPERRPLLEGTNRNPRRQTRLPRASPGQLPVTARARSERGLPRAYLGEVVDVTMGSGPVPTWTRPKRDPGLWRRPDVNGHSPRPSRLGKSFPSIDLHSQQGIHISADP